MNNQALVIRSVRCAPFQDQRMGTAGLRKKVRVFSQPHYLECFVQAVLDTVCLPAAATLVIGGDGRFYNDIAIQLIIRVTAAAGVQRLIIGRGGLLSTPAASHLIRARKADGGFLLTASHNPGGPDGDFGIKFNMASGGQAPPAITDAVYDTSRRLEGYRLADLPAIDLACNGTRQIGPLQIEVVDPVADYERLMEQLFDFGRIRAWLGRGHRLVFDALHGITGLYARQILCQSLGADATGLLHAETLPDFGGLHPDPNPIDGRHLVERSKRPDSPDLLAASDGDGDRNMILGPGLLVSPGDSVAMMLANASHVPGYRQGVPGVARSMPTSRALDAVAADMGLPCFETPTGWRFFCNLLDSGRIGLCGEESFGTGSWHTREKDGLWAVLFWLNLLAALDRPLPSIAAAHWRRYGRHYFQRRDYEISEAARGEELIESLRTRLPGFAGERTSLAPIEKADEFDYRDPVDSSEVRQQGIRVFLTDGSRIVYRLSGTGTAGATLRVYLERHERATERLDLPAGAVLDRLGELAASLARIPDITGLSAPSMVV
ncbi:MAG: alpha-D-glucose phosphate-specific phosphoglucomutase [Gammaproteobacteria bacterium]|nr:MAG: alpha-D-glucose phosphate-specific phosphoglucomutase [Gammaproteobacteria bacterium]